MIEKISEILGNLPTYILLINGVLVALIALFAVIPGDQPEKALQKVVDIISKLSLKKK